MNQSLFKRPFLWYGIYYGIATIVLFVLIYSINFEFFGHFFMWLLLQFGLLITFMILGGLAERKENNGYLKYITAFKYLFFIGVIGYLLNILFTIIFVNFIDPEFNSNLAIVVKESTAKFMQSFGEIPDDKLDETMANMDKQFAAANEPFTYLKQFFNSALGAAIFALLCALFIKRNPPENLAEATLIDQEN